MRVAGQVVYNANHWALDDATESDVPDLRKVVIGA